jgi:hypothetical protein
LKRQTHFEELQRRTYSSSFGRNKKEVKRQRKQRINEKKEKKDRE